MIPIIIGVTGHRDIPAEYQAVLENAISKRFDDLRAKYPNTPFVVMSGAASGADTLVARVALAKKRFSHIGVLPFEVAEYRKDFANPNEMSDFEFIYEHSTQNIECTRSAEMDDRNLGYIKAGQYIIDHSQILVCLWDGIVLQENASGVMEVLPGGTAHVVQMAKQGRTTIKKLAHNDPLQIEHILTPRQRHSSEWKERNLSKIGSWQKIEGSKNWTNVFDNLEEFNREAKKNDPQAFEKSKHYLFDGKLPAIDDPGVTNIINVYAAADALAFRHQRWRSRGIVIVSLLGLAAVISLQIFQGFGQGSIWMVAYFGLAMLAVSLYWFMFRGSNAHEDKFLDWRSLAECLRVEVFWTLSGVDESASDFYLAEDVDEIAWLKTAVRNTEPLSHLTFNRDGAETARLIWLEGQQRYYARKSEYNYLCGKRFSKYATAMVASAVLAIMIMALLHFVGDHTDFVAIAGFCSAIFLLGGATVKSYSTYMAFSDLANRYKVTARTNKTAMTEFDLLWGTKDWGECEVVIADAGKDAIGENSAWLRTHRSRKFEVNLS